MTSYREFSQEVREAQEQYKYSLGMDVASYFNAIYHHDLISFVREANWSGDDVEGFGQLLREANAGRSIDCLPHGLNPSKTVGAEFLKFVDNNARLKCPLILRFTDDIYVFSNSFSDLLGDMLTIQGLLGEKSLSLNSAKTRFNEGMPDFAKTIGDMKIGLLQRRQKMIEASGGPKAVEVVTKRPLTVDETDYLLKRLQDPELEESDAELALVLLRDHGEEVLEKITDVLPRFPALTKTLHTYLRHAGELRSLGETIKELIKKGQNATEYQLFWLAKIAEDFLMTHTAYGDILMALYEHHNATTLSRAKLLEIPEHRFGMPDLRVEQLRNGQSNWLAWSAAVGCRKQAKQARNHLLNYCAKGSQMNALVCEIVKPLN